MTRCAVCSTENAADARFCNGCGSRLATSSEAPVTEERKVITALFCDLVGFTATSEGADPEDARPAAERAAGSILELMSNRKGRQGIAKIAERAS